MISDSPYQLRAPVLTPLAGIMVGFIGSLVMLILITILRPISGLALNQVLNLVGAILLANGGWRPGDVPVMLAGLAFHASLGALFGLLYAVSQQRGPVRGQIGVGVFYGFLLWVIGNLCISLIFGGALRAMAHSWTWLLACLAYGLCLAGSSIWSEARHPRGETEGFPLD